MRSLTHILAPVDFSERSAGAVRCARALAERFHSELTLVHVLTPLQYQLGAVEIDGAMLAELCSGRAEQATLELDGFLAAELKNLSATRVLLEGDPAHQIVEFAHRERADLILMATHGLGMFRRYILGSSTAKVLHDADCPVWTGAHLDETAAAGDMHFRNVLCAVDLGPQSANALCWASWFSRAFDARLTLLHAALCRPDNEVREELCHLVQSAGSAADLLVEAGDPARVICSAAERLRADVLVIGRGSAAGVYGRLRTNAYAIIRQSPCPVVSV